MPVDLIHHPNVHRNQDQDNPGTVQELRGHHYDQDDRGDRGADTVDHHVADPARLPVRPPPLHHPGLRQGKRQKHAQGVKRDQRVGAGAKEVNQAATQQCQHHDAVGKHEPVAEVGQLAGQKPIAGQDRGQPREVGKAGVGGQD